MTTNFNLELRDLARYMVNAGYDCVDEMGETHVYFGKIFHGDDWVLSLTKPHDGNKNRWMLRAERSEDFDRWSNAGFEQFYDTKEDFIARAIGELEEFIS